MFPGFREVDTTSVRQVYTGANALIEFIKQSHMCNRHLQRVPSYSQIDAVLPGNVVRKQVILENSLHWL
jgi:hypothetical protein